MIYSDKELVAGVIKKYRLKTGLKQNQLAEKIGISEKHLSKIERAKNMPSLDCFFRLSKVLNFTLEDFGVSNPPHADLVKEELLKFVYTADDKRTKAYLTAIKAIDDIVADLG